MRTLISLVLLLLIAVPGRAQVDVSYGPLPATEAELLEAVIVAVRGRVEARSVEKEPGPATSVYSVRILELIKNDGRHSVGGLIDVHRHGGLDAENVDREFPAFEVNDEVVLFLEQGQNGWYWPLGGPHSAFKVTKDGRIHAYGKSGEIAKRHEGRAVGEFLAELRKSKR